MRKAEIEIYAFRKKAEAGRYTFRKKAVMSCLIWMSGGSITELIINPANKTSPNISAVSI